MCVKSICNRRSESGLRRVLLTSEGNQTDCNSSVWWGRGMMGYQTAAGIRGKLQGNYISGPNPVSYYLYARKG